MGGFGTRPYKFIPAILIRFLWAGQPRPYEFILIIL
jgi:hypothetical protein